jgi:hypothetical protein
MTTFSHEPGDQGNVQSLRLRLTLNNTRVSASQLLTVGHSPATQKQGSSSLTFEHCKSHCRSSHLHPLPSFVKSSTSRQFTGAATQVFVIGLHSMLLRSCTETSSMRSISSAQVGRGNLCRHCSGGPRLGSLLPDADFATNNLSREISGPRTNSPLPLL